MAPTPSPGRVARERPRIATAAAALDASSGQRSRTGRHPAACAGRRVDVGQPGAGMGRSFQLGRQSGCRRLLRRATAPRAARLHGRRNAGTGPERRFSRCCATPSPAHNTLGVTAGTTLAAFLAIRFSPGPAFAEFSVPVLALARCSDDNRAAVIANLTARRFAADSAVAGRSDAQLHYQRRRAVAAVLL